MRLSSRMGQPNGAPALRERAPEHAIDTTGYGDYMQERAGAYRDNAATLPIVRGFRRESDQAGRGPRAGRNPTESAT